MRRFYTFTPERGRVVHAVVTRWVPVGSVLVDMLFGGGMRLLCRQESASGAGTVSEELQSATKVTCRRCRARIVAGVSNVGYQSERVYTNNERQLDCRIDAQRAPG